MPRKKLLIGLIIGASLAAPLIAVSYLADQLFDLPFVAFSFFNWLTPLIPGPIITFGIDAMIDTMIFLQINVANSAKSAEQVMAVLMFTTLTTAVGGLSWYLLLRREGKRIVRPIGVLLALGFSIFCIAVSIRTDSDAITIASLSLLFLIWGFAIHWTAGKFSIDRRSQETLAPIPQDASAEKVVETLRAEVGMVEQISRRQFLITLGASAAAITVAGTGVGLFLSRDERRRVTAAAGGYVPSHTLPNANDPVLPVPGTRWEYTPIEEHYKVFLEIEESKVEAVGYILPISGLVDNPLEVSIDDLYNRWESRDQYVTLSCISGRVGTTLISTTKWTGVPLQTILDEAGVSAGAKYLRIESVDGFHETISLELIASEPRIMLCHSWDDQPLPDDHGFPCRIWIPDRFGMKQPKWIVKMELVDTYVEGYWVERGWDEIAQVKTTSVIDTVAVDNIGIKDGQRVIPIGGIAWAGDRQISSVEVRVDETDWLPAQLRSPLSETTWVIWRFEWPFAAGDHKIEVRAFEADGTPQITDEARARPSGATGIHFEDVEV